MTKSTSWAVLPLWLALATSALADVVINEIHYSPALNNEASEFIELYNAGSESVDLSGWEFTDGFAYNFPDGTTLAAGAYYILAENEDPYNKKFGSIFANGKKANGAFESGQLSDGGEEITLRNAAGEVMDRVSYDDGFPWPVAAGGDGPSMELIHPSLDNDLGGSWRSGTEPTPGEENSIFAEAAPPHIRQVAHKPKAPLPGEDVIVSAKVTDPDTVKSVTLRYQLVQPGKYLQVTDDAFLTDWTDVPMADDGQSTDTYTATLPGDLQKHRHLMRYQIRVEDGTGNAITVPYPDDGQPNFAYYCYGDMPAWTGAVEPGETEDVTYSPELLQTVPVYQLITSKDNHVDSQNIPGASGGGYGGDEYRWKGTLVYDGEVYDHISFRARGGVWRYAMGKNMWKFLFNRSHEFQARNALGEKYPTKWRRLNFSAMIQQGNFGHRGEQGLFESVGFDLFKKAGVPAPQSHYLHFRIVENSGESNLFKNQYGTDFQGVYLAIEQIDGRFLRSRDMVEGNIYKMENSTGLRNLGGELKNVGNYPSVSDYTDLETFKKDGYESRSNNEDTEWWRANFHLTNYYSYRSILEYIHHYDTGAGKNYYYYHDHVAGLWQILPWDLDLTWDDSMYSTGNPHRFSTTALDLDDFKRDYQNRLIELEDLLFNEEQTGMLIDERASAVYTPGETSLVDADRMMWDYNPIMKSNKVNSSKSGVGRFYGAASSRDFAGMIEKMKEYVPHRIGFVHSRFIEESRMPKPPTVTHTGGPDFKVDDLSFESSEFSGGSIFSPQAFAAMKWRLAEVTDVTAKGFTPEPPNKYEIDAVWESEVLTEYAAAMTIPTEVVRPGRVYRVRARMQNDFGYWSSWSAPVQFVAGQPDIQPFLENLVISEILYNPSEATEEERLAGFQTADFEFVELLNLGTEALDLTNVRFTKGIDFDFSGAMIQSIAPSGRLVLARNQSAFESRYGQSVAVLGDYAPDGGSKLDNNGERLKLSFGAGVAIRDLRYDNGDGWPELDKGVSLNLLDTTQLTDHTLASSWGAGSVANGTPGTADGAVVVTPPGGGGYAAWQKVRFSEAELSAPEISGPLADPDQDGLVNLQDYAFSGTAPELTYLDGEPNLKITPPQDATDVRYAIERSEGLDAWEVHAAKETKQDDSVYYQLNDDRASFWRIVTTLN